MLNQTVLKSHIHQQYLSKTSIYNPTMYDGIC